MSGWKNYPNLRKRPHAPNKGRGRLLLLVGFASAMRRSELVALNVADLEWTAEGVMIRISRSKTDQEGLGQSVASGLN